MRIRGTTRRRRPLLFTDGRSDETEQSVNQETASCENDGVLQEGITLQDKQENQSNLDKM